MCPSLYKNILQQPLTCIKRLIISQFFFYFLLYFSIHHRCVSFVSFIQYIIAWFICFISCSLYSLFFVENASYIQCYVYYTCISPVTTLAFTDVYMYFTLNFYLCTTFCLILLNGIAQLVRLKPSFILWLICLTAPFPVVVAKWRQTCQTKRWQPSQGKTNVFARFSSSCVRAHKPTYAKCLLLIMTGGETFRPLQWNLYDDDILITQMFQLVSSQQS